MMNLKIYFERFPVTSGIIIINLIIFVLNHLGYLSFTISQPHVLNAGTFLAHFSHFEIFHILMNMAVCYRISPLVEIRIKSDPFLLVVLAIWFLTVGIMFPFQSFPTLGFSGIMMGILMFVILLYREHHEFSKNLFGWLVLNIFVGFLPNVSFIGHLSGALAGLIVFGVYWGFEKLKNKTLKH